LGKENNFCLQTKDNENLIKVDRIAQEEDNSRAEECFI